MFVTYFPTVMRICWFAYHIYLEFEYLEIKKKSICSMCR